MTAFLSVITTCLGTDYANFRGRIRRRDFWWFQFFLTLFGGVSMVLLGDWSGHPLLGDLLQIPSDFHLLRTAGTLLNLSLVLPNLSATIRRAHDANLSGWAFFGWFLGPALVVGLALGPIAAVVVAVIAFLILMTRPTSPDAAWYGPAWFDPSAAPGPDRCWSEFTPTHRPPRPWRRIVLALAGLGAMAWFDLSHLYDARVYARPQPDGSLEYDLRLPEAERFGPFLLRQQKPEIWSLRFPPGLRVIPTEEAYWQKHRRRAPEEVQGSAVGIAVALPGFGPLPATGAAEGDQLGILLPIRRVPYERPGEEPSYGTFRGDYARKHLDRCQPGAEVVPGLVRLEDKPAPAAAEDAADDPTKANTRSIYQSRCTWAGEERYEYRDAAGQMIGHGLCGLEPRLNATICTFEVWLPQERVITYSFPQAYLGALRAIDGFARDLLARATVLEASVNIPNLPGAPANPDAPAGPRAP